MQFRSRRAFSKFIEFLEANAVFTRHFTAQSIDAWEQVAMEGFNLVEPFFRRKAFFIQRQNMDIAIADMGNSYAIQAVFFTEFRKNLLAMNPVLSRAVRVSERKI